VNYQNEATERLFQAILSLNTLEECKSFFEDACTIKEILDIAQRFEVARMLTDKMSYQQISQQTGVSTATISRVNRCITYGGGGYKTAIERLKEQENAK
jgi:TrpR-related protein YerC/YecD